MKCLVTSDLHLTDKAEDAYRYDLFPWLARNCLKYNITDLCILGDLTDAKDRHPASLVLKIVEALQYLIDNCDANVHILKGNHDYLVDAANPFFSFLDAMDRLNFYSFPTAINANKILFLPNSRNPKEDWKKIDFSRYQFIFMHQGFVGAVTSSGFKLETGAKISILPKHGQFFSGDIHVPQQCGPVTYVGTPYPIHFDDDYSCRTLILSEQHDYPLELVFPSIRKVTLVVDFLEDLDEAGVRPGDQVKLRINLPESKLPERLAIKRRFLDYAENRGVNVHKVEIILLKDEDASDTEEVLASLTSKEDIVAEYAKANQLSEETIEVGFDIVRKGQP